jgi:quercetin dioxygenase-like cupin family protein
MEGLTICRRDELERTGNWLLARRSLGLSAFGMNLVEIPAGEQIPEHDETDRDHEEVFIVLAGSPTLVVDGSDHELPEGAFARLDPALRRTVVNRADGTASVLIVSAPRSSGYTPMEWA